MVLAGGEFAYGAVSMPIGALPSSTPKTKRRFVAGAMVVALVALCALICVFFISQMTSDHSLQQHSFNPMIGDLAKARSRLAAPDAVPLPPVSARSAVESDKVSRLHARLIARANVAAVSTADSAAPVPSDSSIASSSKPAAKAASPDDDEIVAALKATLDKEEKDAELKEEQERRKQAGAKILEEFHNPRHLSVSSGSASAQPRNAVAAAPQSEQDTEAALRNELDMKFEADKQKALAGVLAEERAGLLSGSSPLSAAASQSPSTAPLSPSSLASKMLEKTEAESADKNQANVLTNSNAQPIVVSQGCVSVKCLTEQLDKKTDADQAKLFAQMRQEAIREHLSPPPAHVASNLDLAASAAKSEASAAQSPAEAAAAHVIKTAADAAKALPAINAAIEQNEREYADLAKSLPSHAEHQLASPKLLTPQQKYEHQMQVFEENLQKDEHAALVHQQADLRAATALEEEEKQHAAAKLKLVQAITAAKVGKDIPLVPAPHM